MNQDEELIQIFKGEASDILEKISDFFNKWKDSGYDSERLAPILREMHTLKGSARMVGLIKLNEYIQTMEEVFQNVFQKRTSLTDNIVFSMQKGIDFLSTYLEKTIFFIDEDIFPIDDLKEGVKMDASYKEDVRKKEALQEGLENKKLIEYLRIDADQLEKFSTFISEIELSRRRVEHNLRKMIDSSVDVVKEVGSLRDQTKHFLLKMDSSVMQGSLINAKNERQDFDTLEMDRYSLLNQFSRLLYEKADRIQMMIEHCIYSLSSADFNLVDQKRSVQVLEELIMHSRLISVRKIIPRLERVVRQVSNELSKKVKFQCLRAEGEIDRRILENLTPALEHMVRNAIDHGIEPPEIRKKMNKDEYGTISLSLFKQGGDIIIKLEDDGQGLDVNLIKQKAVEKKLWKAEIPMSEADAIGIILLPGFSTKMVATPISGHGVGLDVVNTEVNKLGGVLSIRSQLFQGMECILSIPLSLSTNQALVFSLGKQHYGLSLLFIESVQQISVDYFEQKIKKKGKLKHNYKEFDLICFADFVENKTWYSDIKSRSVLPVILLDFQDAKIALVVDELIGSWEVVIKPLNSQLQGLKELAGVSFLGDERIILILDPMMFIKTLARSKKIEAISQPSSDMKDITILIVDDSVTVRRVTARFLKQHNLNSAQVRDGKEALAYMAENIPELVLLDLEMPEMDGFEVLKTMRQEPRLQSVPVIVITSRAGDKHRERVNQLGVSGYFTKPYIEEHLLALIRKILNG